MIAVVHRLLNHNGYTNHKVNIQLKFRNIISCRLIFLGIQKQAPKLSWYELSKKTGQNNFESN